MLELELSVLKKQTNPSFEAHRKISRGLWEKGGKKKKKTRGQMSGLQHPLRYAFQGIKVAFGLGRGGGRCPCCDSSKSRVD